MSSTARNPKPTSDMIFRKLFGGEENKDLLMALINSAVGPYLQIVDMEIKNPVNLEGAKGSIVDTKARADDGNWYIIEMKLLSAKIVRDFTTADGCRRICEPGARRGGASDGVNRSLPSEGRRRWDSCDCIDSSAAPIALAGTHTASGCLLWQGSGLFNTCPDDRSVSGARSQRA